MADQGIRYTYDGTFEGCLCAVLAALRSGKVPAAITDSRLPGCSGDDVNVTTNYKDAQYLYNMISVKSSAEVQQMASDFFLTDSRGLEIDLYKMIFCSLKYGARVAEDYRSDTMKRIQMAIRDLYREAQSVLKDLDLYMGEEASCSMINPRNSVLPIIKKPVLNRRDIDGLLIYDRRHQLLLERYSGQDMLLDISDFPLPEFRDPPEVYSYLWPFIRERRFEVRVIPGQNKSGPLIEPLWLKAS